MHEVKLKQFRRDANNRANPRPSFRIAQFSIASEIKEIKGRHDKTRHQCDDVAHQHGY